MNASGDDSPPGAERDEGWDETVLVWNGTVARIRAPAVQPESARGLAEVEGDDATRDSQDER